MIFSKKILITYKDGLDSIKLFCAEFDKALTNKDKTYLEITLKKDLRNPSFDEQEVASAALKSTLDLVQPMLDTHNNLKLKVVYE